MPPPPRTKPVVLASVKSKILLLESRQKAINALAKSANETSVEAIATADSLQVQQPGSRRDSGASEAPSYRLPELERAMSVGSFKAPMLRRGTLVEADE